MKITALLVSPGKLKIIHSVITWSVGQSMLRHRVWQKLLLCLFCVFMTRVGQCLISLRAQQPLDLHLLISLLDTFIPLFHKIIGRAIAQAVSSWLSVAKARVRARVWSCGICGGHSSVGEGLLRVLRFPCQSSFCQILQPHIRLE
jgi:hypothetical protein